MDANNEIKIGVRELRGNLSHYLRLVASGTKVLVTSRDVVVAEMKAPSPNCRPRRRRGGLKGRIWMADDVNLLPDDVLQAMESAKF